MSQSAHLKKKDTNKSVKFTVLSGEHWGRGCYAWQVARSKIGLDNVVTKQKTGTREKWALSGAFPSPPQILFINLLLSLLTG